MYKLISTGLGIGYIPKGGGTVASVFCCIVIYLSRPDGNNKHDFLLSAVIAAVLCGLGVLASYKVERHWGKDNYRVVIDEIAGMWIGMMGIPVTMSYLITGLLLFRIFDIAKPFYIRRMEHLPGGVGVMMDDVLAGIYTNILLQIIVAYNLF